MSTLDQCPTQRSTKFFYAFNLLICTPNVNFSLNTIKVSKFAILIIGDFRTSIFKNDTLFDSEQLNLKSNKEN